jgi:hypothetical protein
MKKEKRKYDLIKNRKKFVLNFCHDSSQIHTVHTTTRNETCVHHFEPGSKDSSSEW